MTPIISAFQKRAGPEYEALNARLSLLHPSDYYASIVSFHEQVGGWYKYLNRAKEPAAVVRAYGMFDDILRDFSSMNTLSYDEVAAQLLKDLRAQKVRVATMDLRIASIALARNYTLLTRNTVDFERVPGLKFEDWTRA